MVEGDLFEERGGSNKIDFKAILLNYLQYWYLFVAGALLCLGVAFLHMRYNIIPQYYINATILIKDDKSGSGMGGSAALSDIDMFKATKNIDNEIILLRSKSLMQRVLTELSYNTSYYREGRVHDVEVFSGSLPFKLIVSKLEPEAYAKTLALYIQDHNSFELEEKDAEGNSVKTSHQFGQQIKKPYASFTVVAASPDSILPVGEKIFIRFHNISNLAQHYSSQLFIAPVNKDASVLNINLKDPVWERGITIVAKLIEVYEKEAVEDKNLIASNTLSFIDERLRYLTAELTDVEKNVEQYKKENGLTDVGSDAQLFTSSASEYSKKLADLDIQIEMLSSIETYLQKQGEQFELIPSSLDIQDPTLLSLIAKFNELQLQRQRMLRGSQPDHPLVINMNEQLANLRVNIRENLRTIKNGLGITRQNLLANSARFESKKRRVPAMERELLEINRQQSVKAGLYLYLLQKREESALSLAATVSNTRIIDAPSAGYPDGPNKMTFYMMAILFGMAVPFAVLYLRDMLNDKVQHLREVEKSTATPILGELAHDKTGETIVVTHGSRSVITEMFRHIRTNLQFATAGKENKVILITSSMSGEGKTFFSINLGASLVSTGKRVVVLGMDLRKPRLIKALNLPDTLGITNYLISDAVSVNDIVRPLGVMEDLFVIGSGPVPPNPAELMMSPKIGKLINILKESFDYVIIDTAPVGQVVDAFMLAPYIDSTIYLVRYNFTPKPLLETIQKIYKERKLSHPMIVLNDAKEKKGYGYGYGYIDKTDRKSEPASKKDKVRINLKK